MNKLLLGYLSTKLLDPDPDQSQNFYPSAGTAAPDAGAAPAASKAPAVGAGADDGAAGGGEDFGDAGAAGGDAGAEDFGGDAGDAGAGDDGAPAEDDQVDPGAAPAGAPVAPNVVKLDAETIAQIRAANAPAGDQAPQGGAGGQQQMSKEELNKLLNPVQVTPQLLHSMGFENATPEQVAGFQQFAMATVKNAVSVARLIVQQEASRFEDALGPVFAERQQQQMEAARNDFYKGFGHLKNYDKVVRIAAGEVNPNHDNGQAKTKAEIYKEVAAKTVETLASLGVTIKQAPAANLSAGGQRTVPKPNGHVAPGRSGGGGNTSNKPNNPDADIYKR